jgi:hypothetical protein
VAPQDRDTDVFKRYPRPIVHMRSQLRKKRFGVILGSGVGRPLGYPDWRQLIARIASDEQVAGADLLDDEKPLPIQAQLLFARFSERNRQSPELGHLNEFGAGRVLKAKWRSLVHDALYRYVSMDIRDASVYSQFAEVISQSAMTINYNFDDTLERLLLELRPEQETRGYETVIDARLQFQRDTAIIYHPNGFLPRNRFENPSDRVVLTEDSFGDQLIDTMNGQYAALVNHLSKNSCLFIGLSLDDQTLRHILRQHARMNPGHVHYYVRFAPGKKPDKQICDAERDVNFEVFNLVTLFLDEAELAALGKLLVAKDEDIASYGERTAYCFYLSGVPGTGKTATASFLRNLITYDEWLDMRPANLSRPHEDLSPTERKDVDDWVLDQIGKKNNRLAFDSSTQPVGIRIVDRCLTDPIAFSEDGQWPEKARAIMAAIAKYHQPAHPGHVIVLNGDAEELVVRVKTQNKETSPDYTKKLQQAMSVLYPQGPGITHLDLRGYSPQDVAKAVARLIHLEPYIECDLAELLGKIESGAESGS